MSHFIPLQEFVPCQRARDRSLMDTIVGFVRYALKGGLAGTIDRLKSSALL
jgi:hypothetical protein